jgi:hypothetical protein
MNRSDKVVIHNPGKKSGGTNILFAILAENIIKSGMYSVSVIDYIDGYSTNYLLKRELEFELIEFNEHIHIKEECIFVINVLSAKVLGRTLKLNPNTRLLLYTTFTYDFYKYLPVYIFIRSWSNKYKRRIGKIASRKRFSAVKEYIYKLHHANSLIFMDNDTSSCTNEIYDLNIETNIIPLVTDKPMTVTRPKVWKEEECINIFWVGRIADFKAATICSIARALSAVKSKQVIFHVVGNGSKETLVKGFVNKLQGLDSQFYGHIESDLVDKLLLEKCDILIGHGLSILKGARMGVPSLVVDGFYKNVAPHLCKVNWLADLTDYQVGKISYSEKDLEGVLLTSLVEKLSATKLEMQGERSFLHWQKCFSKESVIPKFMTILGKCSFTYQEYLDLKLKEEGLIIKVRDFFKPIFYRLNFKIRRVK